MSSVALQYAAVGSVVGALGVGLSIPALLATKLIPGSIVVAFLACVVAFLILDSWSLAKELEQMSQPHDAYVATQNKHIQIISEMSISNSMLLAQRHRDMSLEALHWKILANKATTLDQIKRTQSQKRMRRSNSCV